VGRIYTVPYTGTLTTAGGNADLFELTAAAQKPIKLRGLLLSQISEVGDAAEEGLSISITRLAATVTTGNGTSVTPAPPDSGDVAASFTAKANGATVATTSGATTVLTELGWNIRNTPFDFWYPDERFAAKAKSAEVLVVRCNTTPADDITVAITAFVEEE
jgi:hypothetical protein